MRGLVWRFFTYFGLPLAAARARQDTALTFGAHDGRTFAFSTISSDGIQRKGKRNGQIKFTVR